MEFYGKDMFVTFKNGNCLYYQNGLIKIFSFFYLFGDSEIQRRNGVVLPNFIIIITIH
jgi:hypothetical protein